MTDDEIRERPNRIPWPPILYLTAVLAAWALETVCPATSLMPGYGARAWLRAVGLVPLCVGVGLDLAAMLAMRRARTNVLPHRGAQHLVTGSVFTFSRNPIYLGNALALAGLALALALPWLLVTTLIVAVLVDRLAIRREERHLSARFGPAFSEYARRVPRWIGLRRR
ncbi:MAG: isoprenylcysteine carboxylmethyltransferase family protein [Rhodanobacter sp.]